MEEGDVVGEESHLRTELLLYLMRERGKYCFSGVKVMECNNLGWDVYLYLRGTSMEVSGWVLKRQSGMNLRKYIYCKVVC